MSEVSEENKSPWIWKVAIVALPVGLAASVAIALIIKVREGEKTGLEAVSYLASDFETASLRDATTKIDDLVGERDFESEAGQKGMQRMTSFLSGSLASLNLGYLVQSDKGIARGGRIWKNYWIDSDSGSAGDTLLVWTTYSDSKDSASVAALLSVAEWLRGREFDRRVRVAFLWGEEGVPALIEELDKKKEQTVVTVSNLGQGSQNLFRESGSLEGSFAGKNYQFIGSDLEQSASDWKLTTSWDVFEFQVRELCAQIRELAGERVVLQKE